MGLGRRAENRAVRPFIVTNADRGRIFLTTANTQTIAPGSDPKLFIHRSDNEESYLISTTGLFP